MLRSQKFPERTRISYEMIKCLTTRRCPWIRRRKHWVVGVERMGLQSIPIQYYNPYTKDADLCNLAGHSFQHASLIALFIAMLTAIPWDFH